MTMQATFKIGPAELFFLPAYPVDKLLDTS